MRSIKLSLLFTSLALASTAQAQTPDQDVRCVMAGNAFGRAETDQAKKQLALATAFFFAGRVDARLSPAQIKAQVAALGSTLTMETIAPVMTACAQSFQAKQRALQTIGQEVARAKAPPSAAPAKK